MTAEQDVKVGRVTARDGARIYYAAGIGAGVPLVYLDPLYSTHVSQQLAVADDRDYMTAIAMGSPWFNFDWRGEGGSSPLEGPLTFEQLVDDVEAVALEAGAGTPCDIASWITGQVAIAFAERRPDLVRRMFLLDPLLGGKDNLGFPVLRAGWGRDPVGTMSTHLLLTEAAMSMDHASRFAEEWFAGLAPGTLDQFRKLLREWPELGTGIREAEVPMVVLLGSREPERVSFVADSLPGAPILPVPTGFRTTAALGAEFRRLWDDVNPVPGAPRQPGHAGAAPPRLTPRELEVLGHVADGLHNDEIAARLGVTPATAARHVSNIFDKLGVHNRAMATDAAHRLGLLRRE